MLLETSRPEITSDIAREYRKTRITTITDQIHARIFQRDGDKTDRSAPQSLQVYDLYGTPANPAEEESARTLKSNIHLQVMEATQGYSKSEFECFGLLVPELVSALVLDKSLIGKVYSKDLPSVVSIAIDWFTNPDAIDQTPFRIGYGGEEKVGARAPTYLVSALETMEKVRQEEGRYGNWAIQHELLDRIGKDKIAEVNKWFEQQIREAAPDQTAAWDSRECLLEVQNPHALPIESTRKIVNQAWVDFLGTQAPIDELQQKYHFTDKVPTLVVFNGANAAIEIDGMERRKVIAARNEMQRFLKSYVNTFTPELAASVTFENDRSWNRHDLYTRLLVLYAHDLIHRANGHIKPVEERLAQFGRNHQRDESQPIRGLSPSEYYASLHPFFFKDPQIVDNKAEKIPDPKIMEPTRPARNVFYHQAHPEITFGVFRKLYSEKATAFDFIKWLEVRVARTETDYGSLAQSVLDKARQFASQNSDPDKPFRAHLGKVINEKGFSSEAKRIFLQQMGTETFKSATNQEAAWVGFTEQLVKEQPRENPQAIRKLIRSLNRNMDAIRQVLMQTHDASDKQDVEALNYLSTSLDTERVLYPRLKVEAVVKAGRVPVYYPVIGIDGIIYPRIVPTNLQTYETMLRLNNEEERRMKGTTGLVSATVRSTMTTEGGDLQDLDHTSDLNYWANGYSQELRELYLETDLQEVASHDLSNGERKQREIEISSTLKGSAAELAERRLSVLCENLGIEAGQAAPYRRLVVKVAEATATEVLTNLSVKAEKMSAIIEDYRILFRHIMKAKKLSNLTEAEEFYNRFVEVFSKRRSLILSAETHHNGNGKQNGVIHSPEEMIAIVA